ncbi:MAG: hypothetical protein NTW10_00045 [Bacteroidetes bacterium]|nr:hypothetical protein [Bacteroidota bacterium]
MSHDSPKYIVEEKRQAITPKASQTLNLGRRRKEKLLTQIYEVGMVIVNCSYNSIYGGGIRIQNSTVLMDKTTGNQSRLLQALNITIAPEWMHVPRKTTVQFTLVFAPLPGSCEIFDLIEDISHSSGFRIQGIKRNKRDIYNVTIDNP